VEAHAGTISLDQVRRGTRFSIRLPIERQDLSKSPASVMAAIVGAKLR
jgi:nitrogen-specific signal transduction histidine kinase